MLSEYERFKEYKKQNESLSSLILPEPEQALREFMTLLKEFDANMFWEDFSANSDHTQKLEQTLRSKLFPEQK
jgi:hypothetical protein